jgi:hypothetical protein
MCEAEEWEENQCQPPVTTGHRMVVDVCGGGIIGKKVLDGSEGVEKKTEQDGVVAEKQTNPSFARLKASRRLAGWHGTLLTHRGP